MSYRLLSAYVVLTVVVIVSTGILGLALRMMTLETSSESAAKTGTGYHVVKRGDVLARIAEKTGVPVEELIKSNPQVDPLALVPGQRIRLRATVPAMPARADVRRVPPRRYTVRPGDNLSSIAHKTGVPLYRLLELNHGIARQPLMPGDRLKLRR